jgi:hypothetical protein
MLTQALEEEKKLGMPPRGAQPPSSVKSTREGATPLGTASLAAKAIATGARPPGNELPAASVKMLSKLLFALKQLCVGDDRTKEQVGRKVTRTLMLDLTNPDNLKHREWVTNAVGLLSVLMINKQTADVMRDHWKDRSSGPADSSRQYVYPMLQHSEVGSLDVLRDRISAIEAHLSSGKHTEG